MKNILVCVDFSSVTSDVLDAAATLSGALGSSVLLLHVVAPEPDFVSFEVGPQGERDALAKTLRSEHRRLQEYEGRFRDIGVDVKSLLVQGPTVEKILEEALALEAELLVMGSHGHGAIYGLVVGSVAEDVLRKAKQAVLVIPAAP